jgi:hypothetical protein
MDGSVRIRKVVADAREAIRASLLVEGALAVIGTAAGALVVLAALDNLFTFPAGLRIAGLLLWVGAVGLVLWWKLIRPLVARWSDDRVAVRIESRVQGLDNGLINAVQLSREHHDGVEATFTEALVDGVAREAYRVRKGRIVDWRALRRTALVAGGTVGAVVLYVLLFPGYLANAMQRYTSPGTFVPPLSSIRLIVEPGDATVVRGEAFEVAATAEGGIPSEVRIRTGDGREAEMLFDGGAFAYRFEGVADEFTYRVVAGDASTRDFRVGVVDRPRIADLMLAFRYPAYTGLPERTESPSSGDVRAVVGTEVTVDAVLNKRANEAMLAFSEGERRATVDGTKVRATFTVERDDTWSLRIADGSGLANHDPAKHRIEAVPDRPPTVEITTPARDIDAAFGETIDIGVRAKDDFGLARVRLLVRVSGGDERKLKEWVAEEPGIWDRTAGHRLALDENLCKAGDVLVVYAVATDRKPGEPGTARSREVQIRVRSVADRVQEMADGTTDLIAALRALIERQESVRDATQALRDELVNRRIEKFGVRIDALTLGQTAIGTTAVRIASGLPARPATMAKVRRELLGLASNEIAKAVRRIDESKIRPDAAGRSGDLAAAAEIQDAILARLRALLENAEELARKLREDPDELFADEQDGDEPDLEDALRAALPAFKKYLEKQREILERGQEYEIEPQDDWTEEEKKALADLEAAESALSKFLEDLKDDLSKLAEQDFSNSSLLKELVEVWGEVERAGGPLEKKNIELAVPLEQSGLELAEKLTTNLEKWLPDSRDTVKWNMEDLPDDLDVPMAELPEELEDLIGELLDDEEDLAEDVEDLTSRWTDSLDKGAGWGTEDGPISNMSAQGKTGNRSPNSSEITGRSGEGRSGRSHGEMVEEEATGKGGRKTPTRVTPDPWESKSVKDSSQDPLGGATGGGKLSGTGGDGLRGPKSPDIQGDLGRLHGRQVEIRQRAEKLDRQLQGLGIPGDGVRDSIRIMRELEGMLGRGDLTGFSRRKGVLLETLKGGADETLRHARLKRDRSAAIPEELMRDLTNVDLDEVPEAYRALIRQYYRILSTGGNRSR